MFWDPSALVPLVVLEKRSCECVDPTSRDPVVAYWWGTPIELMANLSRRYRERTLSGPEWGQAKKMTEVFFRASHEVQPSNLLRETAIGLARLHPLRSADAMQLASAILSSPPNGGRLEFACLDELLRSVASAEGLRVCP